MKNIKDFNIKISNKRAKDIEKAITEAKKLEIVIKLRAKNRRWLYYRFEYRLWLCAILTFILSFGFLFPSFFTSLFNFNISSPTYSADNFYVHFIDVGQGKAIAIKNADGKNFLIDCGAETEKQKLDVYLKQKFFVGKNNKPVFDYFILTHLDADHAGNAAFVFENYEIKNFYRPKLFTAAEAITMGITNQNMIDDGAINRALVQALKIENCGVNFNFEGVTIKTSTSEINFLTPQRESYSDSNAYSPIMIFKQVIECDETSGELLFETSGCVENEQGYRDVMLENFDTKPCDTYEAFKFEPKEFKFLFTGDATASNERAAIAKYASQLKCDVLDVSHHGSALSSTEEFLDLAKPLFSVFSLSENNTFGFPTDEVVSRLYNCGVKHENMLATSAGSVVFSVNESGFLIYDIIEKISANLSDYKFWQIFMCFEVAAIALCFCYNLPPKPRVF